MELDKLEELLRLVVDHGLDNMYEPILNYRENHVNILLIQKSVIFFFKSIIERIKTVHLGNKSSLLVYTEGKSSKIRDIISDQRNNIDKISKFICDIYINGYSNCPLHGYDILIEQFGKSLDIHEGYLLKLTELQAAICEENLDLVLEIINTIINYFLSQKRDMNINDT